MLLVPSLRYPGASRASWPIGAPGQTLPGHGSDLRSVAVRTAMMAMVVSTGLRPAVLVVPMVVIGFGVVDPGD